MKYAHVVINLQVKNIFRQFTYILPDELDFVTAGWRVIVPFNNQMVEGFVLQVVTELPAEFAEIELKSIEDILDEEPWFDQNMQTLAGWIADYYLCSLAEAMRLFIPGGSSIKATPRYWPVSEFECEVLTQEEIELLSLIEKQKGISRSEVNALKQGKILAALLLKKAVRLEYAIKKKIKEKTINTYQITETGLTILNSPLLNKIPAQKEALHILSEKKEYTYEELAKLKVSRETLKKLCLKAWAVKSEKRVLRDSYASYASTKETLRLTPEQEQALQAINEKIIKQAKTTFLLQGVTGSGKTEVYLRSAAQAIALGKQVMVLVPEIALTGQIVERFKGWFANKVAVAHSKLSTSERADVWHRCATGEADILIGVRSAVFAPFKNLGLIIIDEEQEYSYKQENRPCYNARLVAWKRAQLLEIPLVLGSATPDVCSYHHALEGRYQLLKMGQRANRQSLPQVDIVDMREELKKGNRSVISEKLAQALAGTVERQEQAIILLNRRGYSTFVMCRDCGESITCPHCAVSMVYHRNLTSLKCHYCGYSVDLPDECPKCHSRKIKYFGAGTQKAETAISEISQYIKVVRMDQDSASRKMGHEDILRSFTSGQFNVLLGTQMVAKGHDIPSVTLVGILAADSQLNLPDFRSGERTFDLLAQAAGRAGRGEKLGEVIFQVYDAENPVIKLAAAQDYESFAKMELEIRRELLYPPFTQLLKITVQHKNEQEAMVIAKKIVNHLQSAMLSYDDQETGIFGPFPGIVAKVSDLYRINILIKSKNMVVIKKAIRTINLQQEKNVYLDVDPISVV
ncbi:MAG TPA: primosomal protein N' [Candidatus Avacidaminococcus intestinavium]|uniref:Replication restart protein PriA n=1 Tax=Candidatus Avacidaminococcus intestinavium TaxID=2840684 RepID=A0A9D1MP42_9FIRM|nr:primosomal protein N' [Candidatus Avacidaminococcus intestinavium]